MVALIKALQVILALSVLIVIHELGHFMWAKMFHIRVDKFFLFFDIGGAKLFSTKSAWFTRLFPKAAQWEYVIINFVFIKNVAAFLSVKIPFFLRASKQADLY